jgi:hypothetical protein
MPKVRYRVDIYDGGRRMRCTATININGTEYQCERNIGDEHFPREVRHEVKITDVGGKSGLLVSWGTWRRVQPCASGGGTPA